MGSDDRPEDETVDEGGEPDPPASGEQPEGLGLFDDEPEEGPQGDGGPPRRRRRGIYALGAFGAVIAVGVFLVGWTRVASSGAFCASCHEMEPSVSSAARSVHADVTCLSCHTGPGVTGALRYVPTFLREVVTEFTPIDWASGVLQARSCESCHDDIASTPELAAAHATDATCASCHGDVAHPPLRLAGFARPVEAAEGQVHPRLYVQTHGVDVAARPESCVECHEQTFCETCHFRETYPHPQDWITEHGPTQESMGIQACDGCHPQTFCIGCHGTEIPHNARWMSEHWRNLADAGTEACMLCHPKTDCTECHARHSVHREQGLYV